MSLKHPDSFLTKVNNFSFLNDMKVFLMIPEMDLGGVEEGTFDLARGMRDIGIDVTIISGPGRYIPLIEKEKLKWFNLSTKNKTPRVFLKSLKILKDLINQEQPDILHCRSRFPAWVGYYATGKNSRTKFVTSIHGFYKWSIYSRILARGERIIVISDSLGDFAVKKLGADPARVRIVHNGIKFEPYINIKKKQHQKFIIAGVGRLTKLKGFQNLMRAVSIVKKTNPDIRLYLIGDGPYKKRLESLDRKLNINTNFLQGKMSDFLSEIDLLVAPHIETETLKSGVIPWLGRAVYEAQLSCTPVITTLHGVPYGTFIKTDTELLVPPCDVPAMAKAINYVINNQEEMKKIAFRGRDFVIEHFSIEQMVKKTVQVYQELLHE